MFADLIGIYRARRDPKAAARLATRFAQDQALERAKAPLFLPLIVVWAVIAVCVGLVALSLWGYASVHGAVGLLGILPAGIGYALYRLQRGLRLGVARIEAIADRYTEQSLDRLLPIDAEVADAAKTPDA